MLKHWTLGVGVSRRPATRRLALLLSLFLSAALILALPVASLPGRSPKEAAQASASAGDVVFVRSISGDAHIFLHRASDNTDVDLYGDSSTEGQPDVSPDGSRIAFVKNTSTGCYGECIFVMDADGTAVTQITAHTSLTQANDWFPRWSPDGQWLVFVRYEVATSPYPRDVYKIRPDGSGLTQLTSHGAAEQVASWSPDLTKIAYDRNEGSYDQIYIVGADGSNDHRITSDSSGHQDRNPAWSPDGNHIFFASTESGNGDLTGLMYFGHPNGFAEQAGVSRTTLTNPSLGQTDETPRASVDGNTVYFASTRDVGEHIYKIVYIGGSWGAPTAVTSGSQNDYSPSPVAGDLASSRIVVGLGDSIAAGHGLGPSDGYPDNSNAYPLLLAGLLGYAGYDYAITGACAATRGKDGGSSSTPAGCDHSVLSDELPRITVRPNVITLTVGANDIRFGDCFQAVVLRAGDNPCQGTAFDTNLKALSQNLSTLLARIKGKFPAVPIFVMRYYNPLPGIPDTAREICPASRALAAIQKKNAQGYIQALISGTIGSYDNTAADVQRDLYLKATNIVSRLNRTIRTAATAAGARTVSPYFAGHDFCRTLTGGSVSDAWVYGPSLHGSVSGFGVINTRIPFDFDLPSACPAPHAGDSLAYYYSAAGSWFGESWTYDFTGKINCMPHPTIDGQRAIARAFKQAIGSG